jgi:hypothetical protein
MADHDFCPVLREDDNALNGSTRSCEAGLVPFELVLKRRFPSPLRLHDQVEAGRDEFDIGETLIGGVVFLELDNDWRLEGSAHGNALNEASEDRIVTGQTPPEGEGHVVLVPAEEVEHRLDARAVKAKFDHPMRVRDAGCSSSPPRGPRRWFAPLRRRRA